MNKRKQTPEQYIVSHRIYFNSDEIFRQAIEEQIEELTIAYAPKANKNEIKFFNEVLALL